MNQIEIFKNAEFGSVRIIEDGDRYLFCGIDVAKALGYAKPRNAINAHCKGALKRGSLTAGGVQELIFIPEGDVYRLIVHSKLPSAQRFEKWLFDEVMPCIRKHGAYITKEKLWEIATSPEAMMKLCTDLIGEREKNAQLTALNAQLAEKALYFDAFVAAGQCTNLRVTAKELDVPERKFIRFLIQQRYVYRSPSGCVLPYAKPENNGLFCVKDYRSNGHLGAYMLVTPVGKQLFSGMRELILLTI